MGFFKNFAIVKSSSGFLKIDLWNLVLLKHNTIMSVDDKYSRLIKKYISVFTSVCDFKYDIGSSYYTPEYIHDTNTFDELFPEESDKDYCMDIANEFLEQNIKYYNRRFFFFVAGCLLLHKMNEPLSLIVQHNNIINELDIKDMIYFIEKKISCNIQFDQPVSEFVYQLLRLFVNDSNMLVNLYNKLVVLNPEHIKYIFNVKRDVQLTEKLCEIKPSLKEFIDISDNKLKQ